jgi:3-oxoacyl-(acyl-carrier-protein) synthase
MTTASAPEHLGLEHVRIIARADWPVAEQPPAQPGFIHSDFSPLATAAADRVLPGLASTEDVGPDTAVILVSRYGDVPTNTAIARAVDEDRAVAPLLFFQSVPNAVAGHIAKRRQLTGPVYCLAADDEPEREAIEQAELLFASGAARNALLLIVESAAAGEARATALIVAPETGAVRT